MTNKRFTLHIKWYNYNKTEGEAELKDNGQPILISEDVEDMRRLKELLNELNTENQHIKHTITEAYQNERTAIGKSVLKQLLNNIGENK